MLRLEHAPFFATMHPSKEKTHTRSERESKKQGNLSLLQVNGSFWRVLFAISSGTTASGEVVTMHELLPFPFFCQRTGVTHQQQNHNRFLFVGLLTNNA